MSAAEELDELNPDNWLRVDELASIVGVKPQTVYGWVAEGRVPGARHLSPRCIRFFKPDLAEWLRVATRSAKT